MSYSIEKLIVVTRFAENYLFAESSAAELLATEIALATVKPTIEEGSALDSVLGKSD